MQKFIVWAGMLMAATGVVRADGLMQRVEHHYADNEGVKIHYVTRGEGPLVVMIHGFPDFWYTWRHQMEALSGEYKVAAMDQRGYNRSGQPEGGANYTMAKLVSDVGAVIRDQGAESAIVVGHDWGGAVAWSVAMFQPDLAERLIILNLPHFRGLSRELANNPEQQKNSLYARNFQQPDAHKQLTAEGLARWVSDEEARAEYVAAFERSSFEAMMHYYKQNYPREPYQQQTGPVVPVKCPVLMIHGLDDTALLAPALNDTWEWLEKDLTLVTVPGAGHFVQQDAAGFVSQTIRMWLNR